MPAKSISIQKKLLLVAVVIFCINLTILLLHSHAYGMDGYYYAAQIKSYWSKGRFFSRDISPVLYAMTYFSRLGSDIVIMNKIFVSFLAAACVWPAWLFATNFLPRRMALIAAGFFCATAFGGMYKLTFVKNYAAILFFLLFAHALLKRDAFTIYRGAEIFLWLLLTAFSHKLTAGLALFVLFYMVIVSRRAWLIGLLLALAGFLAFFSVRFANVLNWADLSRFDGLFQANPVLPPLEFSRAFTAFKLSAVEGYVFFILFIAFVAVLLKRRRLHKQHGLLLLLCLLAANPFYNYESEGLGFRFYLLLMIPGSIFLAFLFRRGLFSRRYLVWFFLAAYSTLSLWQIQKNDPIDYKSIASITETLDLPQNHLLIVHQGFDYYYCYHKKGDAFHFLPEEKHAARPLFRIAYGIPEYMFRQKLILQGRNTRRLSPAYTLLPELDWQKLIADFSPAENKQLMTWRNPHKQRELYMHKD